MKNLLLCSFVLGMCNVDAMSFPHISYCTRSGEVINAGLADIKDEVFRNMSPVSLDLVKELLLHYQSYIQIADTLSSDDEFTADDAYCALNGVKMQLKEAMKKGCLNKEELIKDSLSSLKNLVERGYEKVAGYKYCLAILCLHYEEKMTPEEKSTFFGLSWAKLNMKEYGLHLMSVAANPKTAGGDDDIDAASYLAYNKK